VGRLAGGVAHDFNNMLMLISGYGRLLLGSLEIDDPRRPDVEAILKAAESATGLTNQLLALSRRQIAQPKVLDFNVLVRNTDRMLRRVIGEDIELVTRLRPEVGKVRVDPGQIEQVLLNLVVNARDAMPGGGSLTIETASVELDQEYARTHPEVQPGRYAMLGVSDTGKGMSEETRRHVFEPFFTTKEKGKGTGLGLSTVYGIVKQSGGETSFTTELGRGTSFRIYLPTVEDGAEGERAAVTGAPETLVGGRAGAATILLVEDEAQLARLIREILEQHGYTVLEAAASAEAIRLGEQYAGPIDLLLTDVVMPQMGGSELARRLITVRPDLKVLYMSGYADDVIAPHGVQDESVTLLQKPFSPELLVGTVRAVLEAPQSR
jgi:CheY-like chemotaxis protein